jgi:hypothetical protein
MTYEPVTLVASHDSVINLISAYQLWCSPVAGMLGRIPLLIALSVIPEGAAKVMLGEEEFFSRPLIESRKDTVVAYQSLELSPQVMALNPV